MLTIKLTQSESKTKKYKVVVLKDNKKLKTVQFGQKGASDYTKHKDDTRKARYLTRHRKRENWTASGITTAGFWSRWLLWNEKTIEESKRDIERRFGVRFV